MNAVAKAIVTAGVVLGVGAPILVWKNADRQAAVATTQDVQDHDWMWTDLESLLDKAAELGAAEFEKRVMARTVEFLQFDEAATARFGDVVSAALRDLAVARTRMESSNAETEGEDEASVVARRDAWSRWQGEQRKSADRLVDVVGDSPRVRLFVEKRLLWLLRLDYGMRVGVR